MSVENEGPKVVQDSNDKKGIKQRLVEKVYPDLSEEESTLGVQQMNRREELARSFSDRIFVLSMAALFVIPLAILFVWVIKQQDSDTKQRLQALEKRVEIIVDTVNTFGAGVDTRVEALEKRADKVEAKQKAAETNYVN